MLEDLLAQKSTQDIANALQVTIKTVRFHLSALFAKTGTSGQRALVQFYLAHPLVGGDPCRAEPERVPPQGEVWQIAWRHPPYATKNISTGLSARSASSLSTFDMPGQIIYRSTPPSSTRLSMPMNVNLTPQLEEMIRQKVASGFYNSASEVVREALRLMEQQDRQRQIHLEELRREIQRGIDSGPAVPLDMAAIRQRCHARFAAERQKQTEA